MSWLPRGLGGREYRFVFWLGRAIHKVNKRRCSLENKTSTFSNLTLDEFNLFRTEVILEHHQHRFL